MWWEWYRWYIETLYKWNVLINDIDKIMHNDRTVKSDQGD